MKQRYDKGDLSVEEFRTQLEQIMVQDAEGRWWAKHRESGAWHYYDGSTWVRGTPPGYQEAASEPEKRPTQAALSPESGAAEREESRRRALPWVLAAGLVVVVALIGVMVYLRAGNVGGTETAEVPNVVGKSRSEAEETLKSARFEVKVETEKSSEENAGRVMRQSPSGGEAEKGSTVAITVGGGSPPEETSGPTPGYNLIQDPSGSLTVEVPDGWEALTGTASEHPPGLEVKSWSAFADVNIASSITATPDIKAWHDLSEPVPGTYIVASRTLSQRYTDEQMIYSGPFADMADNCRAGPSKDFDRPPLSGKMQTWYNCRGQGITNLLVSAAPEDRECVVFVQVRMTMESDRAAAQHILDTLKVDCGGIAGTEVGDRGIAEVVRVNEVVPPV